MIDIIAKKRDKKALTKEEINYFIKGYVNNEIPDYQVSALLMAIYLNGFDIDETVFLVEAMLHSGNIIDLSNVDGIKVDKHSTGGVGDKVTLVLAPIVASFGVKFAKMSGRGLGHTGGTLDKLETIKGFNINMSNEDFIKQVNKINVAVIGQTKNLVPADKLLYSLRDVTATVSSIPLIAASIMSKKLASGTNVIVLDVKVGNGAFMKTIEDAEKLARTMVDIAKRFNKKCVAVLTNMNQPLGLSVGNILEVKEAISCLNNCGPNDLKEICVKLASTILLEAKVFDNEKEANKAILDKIENKEAINKLIEMVEAQNGDSSYIINPNKFDKANYTTGIKTIKKGYVEEIDTEQIGMCSMLVGSGRKIKTDVINPKVGIILNKKIGDYVNDGDVLAYLHTDSIDKKIEERILSSFKIGDTKKEERLIIEVIY